MQKRMIAKYAGTDSRTGYPIRPGDYIVYDTDTRSAWVDEDEDAYMEQTRYAYRSDIFNICGREYYRNKQGRCIDAPCCGCCTI
jgi:hypothetical protein